MTDVTYPSWDWAVFITGILQFGLAWIIIGWAWSIWWGVRMYQDSQTRKIQETSHPPSTLQNTSITSNPSTTNPSTSLQSTEANTNIEHENSTHVIISAEEENPE